MKSKTIILTIFALTPMLLFAQITMSDLAEKFISAEYVCIENLPTSALGELDNYGISFALQKRHEFKDSTKSAVVNLPGDTLPECNREFFWDRDSVYYRIRFGSVDTIKVISIQRFFWVDTHEEDLNWLKENKNLNDESSIDEYLSRTRRLLLQDTDRAVQSIILLGFVLDRPCDDHSELTVYSFETHQGIIQVNIVDFEGQNLHTEKEVTVALVKP